MWNLHLTKPVENRNHISYDNKAGAAIKDRLSYRFFIPENILIVALGNSSCSNTLLFTLMSKLRVGA